MDPSESIFKRVAIILVKFREKEASQKVKNLINYIGQTNKLSKIRLSKPA